MIKTFSKLFIVSCGCREKFSQLDKECYKKPTVNIILTGEKLEASTLRSG